MIQEEWKDVIGYIGLYRISNIGNVKKLNKDKRSKPFRILKPIINKNGYLRVYLYKNKKGKPFFIHRLMLETFVGPCPMGMECRHLDGDRKNNKLNNLEWSTHITNMEDQIKHGTLFNKARGTDHYFSKLNEKQVGIIKYLLKTKILFQKEIGKIFGVSRMTISDIKNNKTWKHIER